MARSTAAIARNDLIQSIDCLLLLWMCVCVWISSVRVRIESKQNDCSNKKTRMKIDIDFVHSLFDEMEIETLFNHHRW